jgi:PAS domain S-box-containing protein
MPKYRILVVEDEAIVARDICKRLEELGYQVAATADNGESALAQAREQKPDLVLMDIVIKGWQNGIDVANIIKSELGIPFIYLTAYADDDTVERAKTAEPFGYIIKPFNDRDLNVTIQMALYRNRMEKKLAEREERYRDLFENSSDIIMLLDEQGCFKYVNQRWHQALGYRPDEIGAMNIFDTLDPSCLAKCRNNFKKVLSGEEAAVEAVFRSKDGEKIIVEGNCNSSHSIGKPTWVRGIFRDVTEKKRSQQLQEAMYQIANETALSGNLDELYQSLHNIISRLLDTTNFYIALYDREKDILTFPYFVDEYDPAPKSRPMSGITEYLIRSKKPLLATPDVYQKLMDTGQVRLVGKAPLDWLGVPLLVSDRYSGALVVQTYDQGVRFGEREMEILAFISEQVAFAINRKQSEAGLRESEERYRTLVDQLPAVTFRLALDQENSTTFISRQTEQILGFTAREWVDDPKLWIKQVHSDDRTKCSEGLKKVAAGNGPVQQEYRMHTKDGKLIWAYEHLEQIKDGEGNPLFIQGVMLDITERKQAEGELVLLSRKHSLVLNSTAEGILGFDLNGNHTFVNSAAAHALGYKPEEIIGRSGHSLWHHTKPDGNPYPAKECQICSAIVDKMVHRSTSEVFWRKDGTSFPVEYASTPIIEQGHTVGSVITFMDITARKQAEESLKLSEEKYRSLVEQISDVIFMLDPSGMIQYISPAIERMTRYAVDEITGQPFSKFIHPDDLPDLMKVFHSRLQETGGPYEYRLIDKNGGVIFVRSTSRPLSEGGGDPLGLIGSLTDITQAKQMAGQLQQAQKMEAIGQLAGGIAHDFNNLLAGIIGQAEMLQIKLINQPSLALLAEKILTTAEHAASLTRQLLTFARKGNYQQVPVNIHRIVAEVAGILGNTVNKNINVRQALSTNPCTVLGDPSMLENALLNLCINARDAMPKGGNLNIATQVAELDEHYVKNHSYKIPTGKYIRISVSDTGQGMSREIQTHLFEPFFTTKEQGRGTGLGLASVYGYVKAHNGSIEVYSEEGQGSTFNIYLPLAETHPEKTDETANEPAQKGTGNILLVDDEETIRDITSQMLEDQGYKVITLANGLEAVNHYREHFREIDLVILDMIMPKMNGHDAFIKMKEINPGVRALLSSGYSIQEEAQDLMNSGVRGFLQKPYRLAELTQLINQALSV